MTFIITELAKELKRQFDCYVEKTDAEYSIQYASLPLNFHHVFIVEYIIQGNFVPIIKA